MNFKEFENTYRLIGYYKHEKTEVIKELLSLDDLEYLYNSFAKELNFNLLEKDSKSNKNNVIRYYLTQLRQLQYFFREQDSDSKEKNTEFDLYKELAHVIYIEIYNDIQLACNINKIKFFKLCDEVKIKTSTFDSSITLVYSENKTDTQTEGNKTEGNRTKKLIQDAFEHMDKNGWKYVFKTDIDYNDFVNTLTLFFEYKKYNLPKEPIQLKRGSKTKLGKTLGEIHKELSYNPLKSDVKYLKLVRCLSHFTDETNLYKVLTR